MLDKNAKQEIYDYLSENPEAKQDGVISIIKRYQVLDKDKLIAREYKRIANYQTSRYKDDNNIREIFVAKNNKETIYVNIKKSKDKKSINNILGSLTKKQTGLNQSIAKISSRLKVLENQISIDEFQRKEIRM